MRVKTKFLKIEDAIPKAAIVLSNLDGIDLYNENYGTRHPLAAYNISLLAVAQRIEAVINALNKLMKDEPFNSSTKSEWDNPLLEATDHMLDALMEHLDMCGGILRSFYPSSKDKNFKKVLSEYQQSVNSYRNHIGSIVNYIKHNQGRLRPIVFYWAGGSSLGYFVEGPLSSGGLGPVSIVHPTENTGFSFNRDIPFHICNIFAVGTRLAAALYSVNKKMVANNTKNIKEDKKSILGRTLQLTGDLPTYYFPDELKKPVPLVKIKNNSVLVENPCTKVKLFGPPGGCQISTSYRGDGVTRTFKLPYS